MESPFTLIPVPSVLVCLQVHREIMPLYRRGGSLWIAPSGANPDGLKRKKQDQNRQLDRYSDSHNSTHCLTQQGAGSRQTCASAVAETGTPAMIRIHLDCFGPLLLKILSCSRVIAGKHDPDRRDCYLLFHSSRSMQ